MKTLFLTTALVVMVGMTGVRANDYLPTDAKSSAPQYGAPVVMYDPTTQQPIVMGTQPSNTLMAPQQTIKVERFAVGNTDTGVDMEQIQRLLER